MARPETPTPAPVRPVAALVLGTDAVMHARPLSPARLAEACRRAGYEAVLPSSWGDELVAAACLETLPRVAPGPAMLCACPLVASMAGTADDVARLSFAAPPVAAARYVRELYGTRPVHVTFAGRCPGANDPAINERISPEALLTELRERAGVTPRGMTAVSDEEPEVVHSSERRLRSLPGGAPDVSWLADVDGYALDAGDEIGAPARDRTLYDLAAAAGCVCAGALAAGDTAEAARGAVLRGEPERGTEPVVADARAGHMARATSVPTVRGGRQARRPTPIAPTLPVGAPPVSAAAPTPPPARAAAATGTPLAGAAAPAAGVRSGPAPVPPHERREVGTLLLPKEPVGGKRRRRKETPPSHEIHPERIRPHKSSEPDWDGPRRFPVFGVAGAALLVGVLAFAYVSRPKPYMPPVGDVSPAAAASARRAAATRDSVEAALHPASRVNAAALGTVATGKASPTTAPGARTPATATSTVVQPTAPATASPAPATTASAAADRAASARTPRTVQASRGSPESPAPRAPTAGTSENPAAAAALAAELRHEIELRKARVDSLARRIDSLRANEGGPLRPPR